MPKNSFADYSTTAADNTDIGGINIGEGCAPSNLNNADREHMKHHADHYTTAGTKFLVSSVPFAIATDGHILAGTTTSNGYHQIRRNVGGNGSAVLAISDASTEVFNIYSSQGSAGNAAGATVNLRTNSATGRSINAGGTINGSGADFAEYMTKGADCCAIAAGDICGVDNEGRLTTSFSKAHSFVIKSTNPAYVGGDTWGNADAIGERPPAPALELPEYDGPAKPTRPDVKKGPAWEAHIAASRAFETAQAQHAEKVEAAIAVHAEETRAYADGPLAEFEAALEVARHSVDRIAFSGQVPVNVLGATPGQFIDAAVGPGGSIVGSVATAQGANTVGKVWKILPDGRAWVKVL